MSGTHVTGLVSCSRIFHLSVTASAPRMPSTCERQWGHQIC